MHRYTLMKSLPVALLLSGCLQALLDEGDGLVQALLDEGDGLVCLTATEADSSSLARSPV